MTTSADEREPTFCADAALLRRVQQQNQEQVIGKLLHDLRNPVHSMRLTVELFSQLTRQEGARQEGATALMARAARYVGPAEAALASLSKQTERLGVYLGAPGRPDPKPIPANEWIADVALLLRESTRELAVEVVSTLEDAVQLLADRPRVSHALLRWGLSHAGAPAALKMRAAVRDRIHIELNYAPLDSDAPAAPFGVEELRILIESAGGELVEAGDAGIMLLFAAAG